MKKRTKKIKHQDQHDVQLANLETIREKYVALSKGSDSFAIAMAAMLNVIIATGEFSTTQLQKGVEFVNTETGKLAAHFLDYLNSHPILGLNKFLNEAEEIANIDEED